MNDADVMTAMRDAIQAEATGLDILAASIATQPGTVVRVCRALIERCGEGRPGRAICIGVGKAGLIARKVAATLSSTGTPAIFLHPTEALHGDLGVVGGDDMALLLSNSGASDEILSLMPSLRRIGCMSVALVGALDSRLAKLCDHAIAIGRIAEACPLGLAPSASTTALLALGDALAVTAQRLRAFTPEQYARFHPAGALGRSLMTCGEAMRPLTRTATATSSTSVADCLRAITQARSGSVVLLDDQGVLLGIFTDGDLRRALMRSSDPAVTLRSAVREVATMPCLSVAADALVSQALRVCSGRKINELPVIDAASRVVGMIDIQDLADRGFSV